MKNWMEICTPANINAQYSCVKTGSRTRELTMMRNDDENPLRGQVGINAFYHKMRRTGEWC